jgi:hypothetical protein
MWCNKKWRRLLRRPLNENQYHNSFPENYLQPGEINTYLMIIATNSTRADTLRY